MKIVADLEVHSKHARVVSSAMDLANIARWAQVKGIDLVGTGDFTHPVWFKEIQTKLVAAGAGVYKLNKASDESRDARFLLTSEVSCIYSHKGKGRRVHLLVFLPAVADVEKFNKALTAQGANLFSDGRPIIGLSLAQVTEIALGVTKKALLIPAHVWTPWFGFYGAMSGYDSLTEAFGSLEKYIPAVETGLSSDPAMNWRISELSNRRIVSFGDAHSPQKLGREATVFDLTNLSYDAVGRAIWGRGKDKIDHTIEFYPEEGKYHYTGHRKCGVIYSPKKARKLGLSCPVCGRSLTMGVMGRVETLAADDVQTASAIDEFGVRWVKDTSGKRPPYAMLVPLLEIIAESFGVGVNTKTAGGVYETLIGRFGSEFNILLKTPLDKLRGVVDAQVIDGIKKVRSGDIVIRPGYDGVFGRVKIWQEGGEETQKPTSNQTSLF